MVRRIWRQMKQYAPFLSALDFLPRFTFTITTAVAVVAFLVQHSNFLEAFSYLSWFGSFYIIECMR